MLIVRDSDCKMLPATWCSGGLGEAFYTDYFTFII